MVIAKFVCLPEVLKYRRDDAASASGSYGVVEATICMLHDNRGNRTQWPFPRSNVVDWRWYISKRIGRTGNTEVVHLIIQNYTRLGDHLVRH